ncbi:unnamed protein product [Leptosia nina]|uniref:Peptidase S1 domain-containing protein n=1 Tax=Leptosia nina TaxID=320188 RepID=A0AAV1J438_9NEOP
MTREKIKMACNLSAIILTIALLQAVTSMTPKKRPNLNPTKADGSKQCETKKGAKGLCVHETLCTEDHRLLEGGNIPDSAVRQTPSCNAKQNEWCCVLQKVVTPKPVVKTNSGCKAIKEDFCPWCVSLFRNQELESDSSSLFCAGVMIGTKVVLTAATCYVASSNQTGLWARIPGSSEPETYHTIRYRIAHPSYVSGSRENDFALFILENELTWNVDNYGACLGLGGPIKDACFAFGYDYQDKFVSTLVSVAQGPCKNNAGEAKDVSCGTPIGDEVCAVALGAPVVCRGDTDDLLVYGIVRSPCRESKALLGQLEFSSSWIQAELSKLNLSESNYMFK